MLGSILSGIGNIAGSVLGFMGAKDKNKQAQELANQEYMRQKEFAQQGIRWKVEDAHAAGVHPLFALGASTSSYAPQSIGLENEMAHLGKGLADMGQDVSRAAAAGQTKEERAVVAARNALVLDGMKLDNDIKRATLAKSVQNLTNPAALPFPEDNPGKRPVLGMGGSQFGTDPGTANTDEFVKRYGEPAEYVAGPMVLYNDLKHSNPQAASLLATIAQVVRGANLPVELARRIGRQKHLFERR